MGKGGYRPGAGRKPLPPELKGRKTMFKTISISGYPEEVEKLKKQAAAEGLSVSRYIFSHLIHQ